MPAILHPPLHAGAVPCSRSFMTARLHVGAVPCRRPCCRRRRLCAAEIGLNLSRYRVWMYNRAFFPTDLRMRHVFLVLLLTSTAMHAQSTPITLRADRVLDGRGNILPGATISVDGAKITRVDKSASGAATYDLKGLTLLPGLIDAHSHLSWYFNRQGRYHAGRNDTDTPVQSMLSMVGNAYATLMSGVTTIQ